MISSLECRSKSGHKNSKQIVWKYGTVQIFGDDSKKSLFDSGGKSEEAEFYVPATVWCSPLLLEKIQIRTCKAIILPVVLHGCETWYLTLGEEHRLRAFENRVRRRIFGPERNEVTGE
jgi:hypothetical protein